MIRYASNGAPYPSLIEYMPFFEFEVFGDNLRLTAASDESEVATFNLTLDITKDPESQSYSWSMSKGGGGAFEMQPRLESIHMAVSIFLPTPAELEDVNAHLANQAHEAFFDAIGAGDLYAGAEELRLATLSFFKNGSKSALYMPGMPSSVAYHYNAIVDTLLAWPKPLV